MHDKTWYDIRLPVLPLTELVRGDSFDRESPGFVEMAGADVLPRPYVVSQRSPLKTRKAVEALGRFLMRERRFDFPPFSAAGDMDDGRAFLWIQPTTDSGRVVAVGTCSFCWGRRANLPDGWALSWVWFHPYERQRGHLSKAWPYFRARFPGFICQGPWSDAFVRFMLKQGELDEHNQKQAIKRLLGNVVLANHSAGQR